MTTNNAINEYARRLSALLSQIEDIKVEAKALTEIAEQQGINPKALRRVAKEMIMDSTKLRKRMDEEQQLDFFRSAVGLLQQKGIAA